MNQTERRGAAKAAEHRAAEIKRLLLLGLVLAGAAIFLSACSTQTEDLIDRRINNATHVLNLD